MNKLYENRLLALCKKIYPSTLRTDAIVGFSNDTRLFAIRNRMEQGKEILKKHRNLIEINVKALKKYVPFNKFVVIKTFSLYPHTTHDIDVVFKSNTNLVKLKQGLDRALSKKNIIDLHEHISWTDSQEISDDFFWSHLESYRFGTTKILVPDTTLDALIRIAHIPFETGSIRFGELLHIYKQLQNADREILRVEAVRCGWPRTFHRMLLALDQIHMILFGKSMSRPIVFPYRIPVSILAGAVIEKRAWKKLWGARHILRERLGL